MLVNGEYDGANNILLYCRNEKNEKDLIKVIDFEPYFFVPQDEYVDEFNIISQEPTELRSIYGDKLNKVVTRQPRDVSDIRDKYSKSFESDIKFVRRYIINQGIFSGFSLPDGKKMARWDNLKPEEVYLEPRVTLLDIETYALTRFPQPTDKNAKITINCLWDSFSDSYLSFAVHPKGKSGRDVWELSKNHKAIIVPHERDLLELTEQYFTATDPDITSAWYLPFDKDYLDTRAEIVKNMRYPWQRTNTFDLLKAYKRLYAKGSNVLADVIPAEELKVPNYEPFQNDFWEDDLEKAIIVNKSHVEAIKMLNEKLHLLEFYWDLKNLAGFEDLEPTIYHGMLVENFLLRRYHDKWVLPSRPSSEEKERRKSEAEKKVGGKVLDPPFGIFENVGVFDMSRYYPEMLISQNLSPESHSKDELGVVPKIALELIEKRLEYDRELNKLTPGSELWNQMKYRRNSVKYVTESIIGYFGSESSRVFDLDIFNSVTMMGQRGMVFLQNVCNSDGHQVLYFDTDGASIKIDSVQKAKEYVSKLNESLKDFSKKENISRELTLKLDRYFSKIIFKKLRERVDGRWVERGAKKRYVGRVSHEDNQDVDYLKIVGFEYVRRDSSKVTKAIQPKVFDMMLKEGVEEEIKKEVNEYLQSEINRISTGIKTGKIPIDDIAIPKTLSKNLSEYGKDDGLGGKKGIPDYARGAIYCNEWFKSDIRGGDQVKMVYVKKVEGYPKTDVISYLTLSEIPVKITVDVDKMIDRCVKGNLEDVVDLIGLRWDEIVSPHRGLF